MAALQDILEDGQNEFARQRQGYYERASREANREAVGDIGNNGGGGFAQDKRAYQARLSGEPDADATGVVTKPAGTGAGKIAGETAGTEYKPHAFFDQYVKTATHTPETPEQKAKRLKRERSAKILAGVGDMVSSIANLVGTYHGAKSSYNPKEGLSAKMQERFDKLDQIRRAQDKEWHAGAMRAQQQDMLADYRHQADERRKEADRIREENAKERARLAEERAKLSREKFEHQKQVDEDKKNGVGTYGKKGRGGSSRVGGYTTTTYDKNGNPVKTTVRQPAVTKPAGKTANTGRRGLLLPGKQASNTQRSGILLPKKKQK